MYAQYRQAQTAAAALQIAMCELKEQFHRILPPPQPARLVLHRTGRGCTLRWRRKGNLPKERHFFELSADSPSGRAVLHALSPPLRHQFLEFHAQAIALNAAYAIRRFERDRLATYFVELEAFDRTRAYLRANLSANSP